MKGGLSLAPRRGPTDPTERPCHPIRQQRDHLQVNVAVNENPAEPCLGLLSYVPRDQHSYRACPLLHPGSNG
jgi:hypothetical protein